MNRREDFAAMAALLDRLEPPALSADFAARVLVAATAKPPLPSLRRARPRRRWMLIGVVTLASATAVAAASLPSAVLRDIPVVGALIEWLAPEPAPRAQAPTARQAETASFPVVPVPATEAIAANEPAAAAATPELSREMPAPKAEPRVAAPISPPRTIAEVPQAAPPREALPLTVQERPAPVAERPLAATAEATPTPTISARATDAATRPATDSALTTRTQTTIAETRLQLRERTLTRERVQRAPRPARQPTTRTTSTRRN